ncbi:MAG: hypothetical protein HRT67_05675 [Flavobacteriaceae bacterium]|nr:hypothetical protein [Flavobacteriaceae bacterium]
MFICFLQFGHAQIEDKYTNIGERQTIQSQALGEERFYQIYLPPSYHINNKATFPVLYIVDGDYNFHYDSGLVEFLSRTAYKIPEMIVVGISDQGSTKYRANCSPNTEKGNGNAINYIKFINNELKFHIKNTYRASEYDIIVGHSIGGLFTTNYWLEEPSDFDAYIAIDPSLWWNDYALIKKADSILKGFDKNGSQLFISLANTKGMGVQQFVGVLDRYFPNQDRWNYKHYTHENHGSLHMMAISDALTTIFKNWNISREKFYAFETAKDILEHYKSFNTKFDTEFLLPAYTLENIMYFYFKKGQFEDLKILEDGIKTNFPSSLEEFYLLLAKQYLDNKELEKAETRFKQCLRINPNAFDAYDGLAKIYVQNKDRKQALKMSEKALQLAAKQNVRQYLINELQSHYNSILKSKH